MLLLVLLLVLLQAQPVKPRPHLCVLTLIPRLPLSRTHRLTILSNQLLPLSPSLPPLLLLLLLPLPLLPPLPPPLQPQQLLQLSRPLLPPTKAIPPLSAHSHRRLRWAGECSRTSRTRFAFSPL